MSAQPLPIGTFGMGIDVTKITLFTLKTTLFCWQSMVLRSDLTLLNINMSKKSTFAYFFAEKFVLSMIIRIFATTESATLPI